MLTERFLAVSGKGRCSAVEVKGETEGVGGQSFKGEQGVEGKTGLS